MTAILVGKISSCIIARCIIRIVVNLFSDIVACRGRKKKLALYIKISTIYKSSRRFYGRTSLSGRRRRASRRHSERKRCGNMRRREAGQHKGEQCDKRVALRSSFLRSQRSDGARGNPEKHRQHVDASRRDVCNTVYKGQRNCTDHRTWLATVGLPHGCRDYCLLITTAVLWKHRDRSHCRV